jgi:hypothetical protein
MSFYDRDYYREELARKRGVRPSLWLNPTPTPLLDKLLRQRRPRRWLWLLAAPVTILAGVTLAAPPVMTSRCDQGSWWSEPVACWQYSWQALKAQFADNTAATRGRTYASTAPAIAQNSAVNSQQLGACGYYINSNGHSVPRPCGDWHTSQGTPSGATALCADGRYSFSEHPHASWTCSYHGGVAQYVGGDN